MNVMATSALFAAAACYCYFLSHFVGRVHGINVRLRHLMLDATNLKPAIMKLSQMAWPFSKKRPRSISIATATTDSTLVPSTDVPHSPHKPKRLLHFPSLSSLIPHRHHTVQHTRPDISQITLLGPLPSPIPSLPSGEKEADDDLSRAIYWHQRVSHVRFLYLTEINAEQWSGSSHVFCSAPWGSNGAA